MKHAEGSFTGAFGTNLYYQSWKPEGKVSCILAIVHGFGEHSGRYMNIINKLVPSGYAAYAFDHRGHGRSEGKKGIIKSWEEFRQDLHLFLEFIRSEEIDLPIILMGHSMGGLIVLNYLLKNPTENICAVIASSPLLAQPHISPVLVMISRILSRIWPGFTIDTGLDAGSISRENEVVEAYLKDPLVHSNACARFGTELTATIDWTQANAQHFNHPLFIYHGEADQLVPPQGSIDFYNNLKVPDKKFNLYKAAYHETHNDLDKETVLKDVSDWIEQHIKR